MRSWLLATYAEPAVFRADLHAFAAARREGGLRSSAASGFDFYHDCVQAHVGRQRRAVVGKDGRELASLSYEALDLRASALAAAWVREGVIAGQVVAIVLPPGNPFVVAVLAALRLGLVLSIVAPHGPTWARTRLAALEPDRIVADALSARLIGAQVAPLLPVTAPPSREITGAVHHRYESGAVVARLVSPLVAGGAVPYELTADVLHASLVRDAMLVYTLDASDTLAAPGFSPSQHQPQLLLATLLAGATYAELEAKDLDAEPKLFERLGVTVLGIGRGLRDRMIAAPPRSRPAQRAWFRSLSDVLDNERWDELVRALAPHQLLGFEVLSNAPTGGVQLFSAPSSKPGLCVWPAPGESWQLSEIAGGTVPAFGPSGVYTVLREEEADPSMPQVVLAESNDGWLFVGPIEAAGGWRDGRSYPTLEVAGVVSRHPSVQSAAVILAPGRWVNDARVVLLVFVDDASPSAAPPVSELRSLVEREMGEGFVPDRIEVFPLRPRFIDGRVDTAWCRSEYLSGNLGKKARSELFVSLARLGWIFGGDVDVG